MAFRKGGSHHGQKQQIQQQQQQPPPPPPPPPQHPPPLPMQQHHQPHDEHFGGDDGKFLADFKLTMWIPAELGGKVIGLKGVIITNLTRETQCKFIKALQPVGDSLWLAVVMMGEPEQCLAAYTAIAKVRAPPRPALRRVLRRFRPLSPPSLPAPCSHALTTDGVQRGRRRRCGVPVHPEAVRLLDRAARVPNHQAHLCGDTGASLSL